MQEPTTAELTIRGANGRMRASVRWPAGGGRAPGLVVFPGGWLRSGAEASPYLLPAEIEVGAVVVLTMRCRDARGFASAVSDATAAVAWIAGHAAGLGLEPSGLSIAGAGECAGVVLEAARRLRGTGPALAHVIVIDPSFGAGSRIRIG